MQRDPRYDVLFEPVRIGPVTARNRFYQVPHCTGAGHRNPAALIEMRSVKAEGGWAVVCTEEVEIHPGSEVSPGNEGRLWDDRDIPAQARMVDAVHAHGALAGIELVHGGPHMGNRHTRAVPLAPSHAVVDTGDPLQARAMDRADIRAVRRTYREAALRAKRAGFDIVYCYAGHDMSLPMHFISRRWNRRSDEYGGSLENRVRLLREIIEDTRDAVGDTCAVAVRLAVDELLGPAGICADAEGRDIVEMLAELPDLWDVNISGWDNDSATSRFEPEGFQERYVRFVKSVTTKPVVGVGRFTSPDAMVSQIRRGVLDFIGAARPSIADPFLPSKIESGQVEAIRECIGCNICVSGDNQNVPMRCTQNPTVGEEWRRGWHPERIEAAPAGGTVLVVGAGPSGLESALQLARRGYDVTLAEAAAELGGRVALESAMPGLAAWGRVRDHRAYLLSQMGNVDVYRQSELDADQVLELAPRHVVLATGARWRRDGLGARHREPVPGLGPGAVATPGEIMGGERPRGNVVVYDDDHYYLASVLAEALIEHADRVTYVTPACEAATWTRNTLEQHRIQRRLLELGVEVVTARELVGLHDAELTLACVYTGRESRIACDRIVPVTSREPSDALHQALSSDPDRLRDAGIATVRAVGDALAPGTIAMAVYSGHLAARELEDPNPERALFRRELVAL